MPKTLNGSCQCGLVTFTLQSHTPTPYQLCACSICRKLGGNPSGAINLGGLAATHRVLTGASSIKIYHAISDRGTPAERRVGSERHFCGECSTMLWLFDKQWPELIHPFASAIDTELDFGEDDEMVCLMGEAKVGWARWPEGRKRIYGQYPEESIEGWHQKNRKYVD